MAELWLSVVSEIVTSEAAERGIGLRHGKDPADTVLESGGFSRESALSPVAVNSIAL